MVFKFSKSIKMGPVRVNLSTKGVGYSVGVKGARVTKRADGRTQTTLSIPGTGISHASVSGNSNRNNNSNTSNTNNNTNTSVLKNKQTAVGMSFLFGILGFHKFYLGEVGSGFLRLLFCWTTIPLFLGWYDAVKLNNMSEEEFNNRFNNI